MEVEVNNREPNDLAHTAKNNGISAERGRPTGMVSQGETEKLRHVLILEEAHNIFPAQFKDSLPHGGLENVYREIRSFGQALIAITQHPSLLPIYVLGNTHTLIFLSLTHEADIISARQALFLERGQDVFLTASTLVREL